MQIAVIIPTYNEAGAIGGLIEELQDVFETIPEHTWDIVVVDANSQDGTPAIVREKSLMYDNMHLIVESQKRGIGVAYLSGIDYSIRAIHADAFIEFDGDGQHDPENIRRLIRAFERGFDYVIGSRYIPGGSVPANWGLRRRFLSRFGSAFAQRALGVPVRDTTSGFKITRVSFLTPEIPLSPEKLLSNHYAYKLHVLMAMVLNGARVCEVPIAFRMREYDASKQTWADMVESLKVIIELRKASREHTELKNLRSIHLSSQSQSVHSR